MKPRLRIGILVDSYFVPHWEYSILEQIKNSDYAEVCLIVYNNIDRKSFRYRFQRLWRNRNRLVFLLYKKIDDYFFKPFCIPDAFEKKDIRGLLFKAEVLNVIPHQNRFSDQFDDVSIKQIKEYRIDVFLRMGFRILKGEILNSARYGVWSYQHSDNMVVRGRPAGYWEVFNNVPVTGAVLQILAEGLDDGQAIYRSWASTYSISPRISRNHYFLKSAYFVPRKLKELYETGGEAFLLKVKEESDAFRFYSGRLSRSPSNLRSLYYALKQFYKAIRYLYIISFSREQWFLKYAFSKDRISTSLRNFKSLIPPKDRFWADPHLVFRDGKYYIFIEELIYGTSKGHISVIEIDEEGKIHHPVTVLIRPYHLSYPFVFLFDGEYYMVPESSLNKTVELWRCTKFPDQWEFVMNLMEGVYAIDTTLLFYGNKWWMFTTIVENANFKAWDELFIFYSDDLLSTKWMPHAKNPVISDVSRARQAGRIIKYNDILYRPSQNCSGRYGYGLKLNKIEVLSESAYKETEVTSIEPKWDNQVKGIHSFAYEKDLTVVDSVKRIRKL